MERKRLWVCDRCLATIESHEGRQTYIAHDIAPEFDDVESVDETRCDWCDEVGFGTLYELI